MGHSLGGSIDSWVRGAILSLDEVGRSVGGSWRNLTGGRGGSIGGWVRGAISSVDEMGRLVGGFMARSELSPVLGCVIGEKCV